MHSKNYLIEKNLLYCHHPFTIPRDYSGYENNASTSLWSNKLPDCPYWLRSTKSLLSGISN
jgi:hypothetical protein